MIAPDTYELLFDFDVPALMLSETLNHTEPGKAAGQLLELRPEARQAALAQAERFFRINLKVEIDGRRQKPAIELPSFEPGPLGRLGDAGSAFQVRVAGRIPGEARSLKLAPGRALGLVKLEAFDSAGSLLRRETLPGGMEGDPITLPRITELRAASRNVQGPGDVVHKHFLLGLRGLLPSGIGHLLFLAALLLPASGWRPVTGQFAAFVAACLLLLGLTGQGYLHVPGGIAESLAAATAGLLALGNFMADRIRIWRPSVVFAFGGVHGVALASPFSGATSGLGATSSRPELALVLYGAGAVAGLLLVTGGGWGLLGMVQGRTGDSTRVNRRLSGLILAAALFWTLRTLVGG